MIHINSAIIVWFMLKIRFFFSRALMMTRKISLTWRLGITSLSLLATLIGGFVALALLTYLPKEVNDAHG